MSKNVYMMVGLPASGKSYFATHILANGENWYYYSRDNIRFSMVKEDEPYFSKEKQVFNEFVNRINSVLDNKNDCNIIADATHLNMGSRRKLIRALHITNDINIIPVVMKTPYRKCVKRNRMRHGREQVPESVLLDMLQGFSHPSEDGYNYAGILEVADYADS